MTWVRLTLTRVPVTWNTTASNSLFLQCSRFMTGCSAAVTPQVPACVSNTMVSRQQSPLCWQDNTPERLIKTLVAGKPSGSRMCCCFDRTKATGCRSHFGWLSQPRNLTVQQQGCSQVAGSSSDPDQKSLFGAFQLNRRGGRLKPRGEVEARAAPAADSWKAVPPKPKRGW